jgi:hypothetical protein
MENNIIMFGYHEETRDKEGKVITPASIIKIYEDSGKDFLGDEYIAKCEQVYARKNKKLKEKITIDDFKGSKRIAENFYNISGLYEFLEMIIDDGYKIKRMTKHNENELADNLFSHTMSYEMSRMSKVMNF